jgi:hypothetical protein
MRTLYVQKATIELNMTSKIRLKVKLLEKREYQEKELDAVDIL